MTSYSGILLSRTLLVCLLTTSFAGYTPATTLSGDSFFSGFTFFTSPDPTQGFVTYSSLSESLATSLIGLTNHSLANESVYIGVDTISNLPASSPGRASVRLQSTTSLTHGLVTLDIYHAPTGCGTWPAIWLVNGNGTYPGVTGEIDIFETVHETAFNSMTLHTAEGCSIDTPGDGMQGKVASGNCWVDAPGQSQNQGCGIMAPGEVQVVGSGGGNGSYATAGAGFNEQGGGVYALVWTSESLEVYFFPRPVVPEGLTVGSGAVNMQKSVDLEAWKGQGFVPVARFTGCDFDRFLGDLQVIVNTDFCGGWAGGTWESSGCAAKTGVSTCDAYVGGHPEAFEQAYWLLGGIEIWKEQ